MGPHVRSTVKVKMWHKKNIRNKKKWLSIVEDKSKWAKIGTKELWAFALPITQVYSWYNIADNIALQPFSVHHPSHVWDESSWTLDHMSVTISRMHRLIRMVWCFPYNLHCLASRPPWPHSLQRASCLGVIIKCHYLLCSTNKNRTICYLQIAAGKSRISSENLLGSSFCNGQNSKGGLL